MEDAFTMRILEGLTDLGNEVECLLWSEFTLAHGLAQVHAIHVFHEEKEVVSCLPEIVKGDDVRVV
jgi:hypothetical protein